jgi:TolB-like protein
MTSNPVERLDSWKEIASYLRRDVRTVQRWEKKEGLPVRRHQHDKLGSVYAYPAELTSWFTTRQQANAVDTHASAEHAAGQAERETKPDKIKLAVLPFGNLSGSAEDNYFSEGLTEEMITQITRLQPAELAVVARSTAHHYDSSKTSLEQMKKDLGVDYVLEGKVRRGGERVRITAQLSEVQDQTQLWAETYERDLSDMLSVQAEIAEAIAAEIHLALNLTESERLTSLRKGQQRIKPAAYDAYLKARFHLHEMTPAGITRSIQDFKQAVELDSSYAPAFAGLASAYALLAIAPFDVLPPHEAMPKAEAAARQSLELDNALAEAHTALALVEHHYHWNWSGAEGHYKRALELNPDYADAHLWYSWLLLALGRTAEAIRQIDETKRIAQETDPHRLVAVHATRALAYYFGRQFQESVDESARGLQLDPKHFMLHYIKGRSHMRLAQEAQAIEELKAAAAPGEVPLIDAALGLAYAVVGKLDEAKKTAETFKSVMASRYIPPTYFGMLYAGLGDRERSLVWLDKAFRERADGLTWLNVDPMLDDMRCDARFQELVERIGLTR